MTEDNQPEPDQPEEYMKDDSHDSFDRLGRDIDNSMAELEKDINDFSVIF